MKSGRTRIALTLVLFCMLMGCVTGTAFAAKEVSIPKGASTYNGHSYMIFDQSVSWEKAQKACKKSGGHLVTITTKNEQKFVEKLLKSQGKTDEYYWIGLTDKDDEGNWSKWVTGEKVNYSNWGKSEPDDRNNQDYGAIATGLFQESGHKIKNGQWDDISGKAYGYICEWDSEQPSEPLVTGFVVSHDRLKDNTINLDQNTAAGEIITLQVDSSANWSVKINNEANNFIGFTKKNSTATIESAKKAKGDGDAPVSLSFKIGQIPAAGQTSKATLTFKADDKTYVYTVTMTKPEKESEKLTSFCLSHVDHDNNVDQRIWGQKDGNIESDKSIILIGNTPGEKFTYEIESDAAWKLSGKGDWFTIGGSSVEGAAGTSYIDLVFTGKVGSKANSGKIVFTFQDGQKITVKVDKPKYTSFDKAFSEPASSLNNMLANQSILGSNAAYASETAAKGFLNDLGFEQAAGYSFSSGKDGPHTVGHEIGRKLVIDSGGNIVNLYAVLIRGTNSTNVEWKSNLTVGNGNRHYGFDQAAKNVYDHLKSYIEEHNEGITNDRYIVWICGHSRGAAVGNLLAGYYLKSRPQSTIYAYLFATPNVSRNASASGNNIKNFIIGGDLIPRVPLRSWGYKKYGVVYTLSDEASNSYKLNTLEKKKADDLESTVASLITDPSQIEGLKDCLNDEGTFPSVNKLRTAEVLIYALCYKYAKDIPDAEIVNVLAENETTRAIILSLIPKNTMLRLIALYPVLKPFEKVLTDDEYRKSEEIREKIYNSHEPHRYQTWISQAYPAK